MKKHILINTCILIFCSVCLYISFSNSRKTRKRNEYLGNKLSLYISLSNINKYSILDEGYNNLSSLLITYKDSSGVKVQNKHFLDFFKDPTLVVRISDRYCGKCIMSILNTIDSVCKYRPTFKTRIVILASYKSFRLLDIWRSIHNISIPIFLSNKFQLNLKSEKLMMPYLFILHPNGEISALFIPYKELPDETSSYLNAIYRKYFSHSS